MTIRFQDDHIFSAESCLPKPHRRRSKSHHSRHASVSASHERCRVTTQSRAAGSPSSGPLHATRLTSCDLGRAVMRRVSRTGRELAQRSARSDPGMKHESAKQARFNDWSTGGGLTRYRRLWRTKNAPFPCDLKGPGRMPGATTKRLPAGRSVRPANIMGRRRSSSKKAGGRRRRCSSTKSDEIDSG